MFEGFETAKIDTGEATIHVQYGGSGPPLLLLHGHPQTHVTWHKIAPRLAQDFTVVTPDLRGYGDSSKPTTTPDHAPYSKRAMGNDQVKVMEQLGFDQFCLVGHDRGGYVASRMALDHPARVRKLVVMGDVPISEAFRRTSKDFALSWWHWFFFAQPYDLPERLIGADPDYFYLNRHGGEATRVYAPEALAEYRRCWNNPETIHAFLEDYRAGATIDIEHDEADRGNKKITCPMLVLWGLRDDFANLYDDVVGIWRDWADDVRGETLDCGHHLAEELPDETYQHLVEFFQED